MRAFHLGRWVLANRESLLCDLLRVRDANWKLLCSGESSLRVLHLFFQRLAEEESHL